MIKSMTGFGQAVYDNGNAQLSIEVKSLNSKFFDLTLRVPKAFADRELELRNIISEKLERGKVSVTLGAGDLYAVRAALSHAVQLRLSHTAA